MSSCEKSNNAGNSGGPSGTTGDSSEGEEQEESSSSNSNIDNVNDVLENFRQQWQRELQVSPRHKVGTELKNKSDSWKEVERKDDVQSRAKVLFLKGAEHERAGKLYEAIQFYKRAVQLEPDIEFRLYESTKSKTRMRLEAENTNDVYNDSINYADNTESDDDDDVSDDTDLYSRFQRKIGKNDGVCLTKYEQKYAHISSLPMEIILYILRWVVSSDLDLRSLEMCSRISRGFYICCRDSEIWRLACAKVWGVNCGTKPEHYISWREMFISRPRLLFNGCYISKTTYIRHGENSFQDQFYRPWHLVEYYRYLRFFPEGKVLMLTSPEEPSQCLGQLRYRNPRHVNVLMGHYRLRDNTVTLLVQRQETKNNSFNYRIRSKRKEIPEQSQQSFQLELQIQNQHKRKHVQLTWLGYSAFTRNRNGTESTSRFDLVGTKFPPLWFSRVKSYSLESDSPLQ